MPWLPPFYCHQTTLHPPATVQFAWFKNQTNPLQKCLHTNTTPNQVHDTIKAPICPCIFVVCLRHQPTVTITLQQQRQMLHSLRSHVQHHKFASRAGVNGGSNEGGYSSKNGVANDGGSSIVLPSGSSFLGSTVLLCWSCHLVMAGRTSPASLLPADTFG